MNSTSKRISGAVFIASCIIVFAYGSKRETFDDFAIRIKDAYLSRDTAKAMKQHYTVGVENDMIKMTETIYKESFKGDYVDVVISDSAVYPGDFENIKDGIMYSPNLDVKGVLKISKVLKNGAVKDMSTNAYGIRDGKYYFPLAVKTKLNYTGPKDTMLQIIFEPSLKVETAEFEGYCTYVVSGLDRKKVIHSRKKDQQAKGSNKRKFDNHSESFSFYGQYFKYCKITKTSDYGYLQVRLEIGGNEIFNSGENTPENPIIYEHTK